MDPDLYAQETSIAKEILSAADKEIIWGHILYNLLS
jgi:hypothetical protein